MWANLGCIGKAAPDRGTDQVGQAGRQLAIIQGVERVGVNEHAAGLVKRAGQVTVRGLAGRQHVVFRAGPPDADEILHREADVHGFLDGDLVHHAPAPHHDVVGALAADLQPLGRLVLHLAQADRDRQHLEPVRLASVQTAADRLPAQIFYIPALLLLGLVILLQRRRQTKPAF